MSAMQKRIVAGVATLLAVSVGAWAIYAVGPEGLGGPQRIEVSGPLAQLDTVALARRVVTASVTGRVAETESETDVLVVDGTGAITVRLEEDHEVTEGATLLAVGRLREGARGPDGGASGANRWVDASAWSTLVGGATPSLAGPDSVRLTPDSTRFGNESDRSPERSDRSGATR